MLKGARQSLSFRDHVLLWGQKIGILLKRVDLASTRGWAAFTSSWECWVGFRAGRCQGPDFAGVKSHRRRTITWNGLTMRLWTCCVRGTTQSSQSTSTHLTYSICSALPPAKGRILPQGPSMSDKRTLQVTGAQVLGHFNDHLRCFLWVSARMLCPGIIIPILQRRKRKLWKLKPLAPKPCPGEQSGHLLFLSFFLFSLKNTTPGILSPIRQWRYRLTKIVHEFSVNLSPKDGCIFS